MKNRKLTSELNKRFASTHIPKQSSKTSTPIVKVSEEIKLANKVWDEISGAGNLNYMQQQVIDFIRERAYGTMETSNFHEAIKAQENADDTEQVIDVNVSGAVLNHLMDADEYDENKIYQITNLKPIGINSEPQ